MDRDEVVHGDALEVALAGEGFVGEVGKGHRHDGKAPAVLGGVFQALEVGG